MDNCYNGRIPRELLHSQEERLSNKHIQTLTFLQDIAKENKQLKERVEELEAEREKCKELHLLAEEGQAAIKEIQKQCLKQTDQVRKILMEKHRMEMMQILEEKGDMEKTLKESILKFQHEIESLQRTNAELRQEKSSESYEQMKERISELELNLKDANVEITNLSDLKEQLQDEAIKEKKIQISNMCQIQHLENMNLLLKENLHEINQKKSELLYKLENLQKEVQNDWREKEQAKLIEKLRNKMEKLVKEKELALLKVSEMNRECGEARVFPEVVQMQMEKLEKEKAEVEQMCRHLIAEIELLRKRLQQEESPSFKDFISMKREVVAVRNENESLRQKMQTSPCALPVLKEDMGSLKQTVLTKKGKKKMLAIAFDQRSENANSN